MPDQNESQERRLSQLAGTLLSFEKRYLAEVRIAIGSEQPTNDLDGRNKVLSIIRSICERDGVDIPPEAFEVLVSNFTIALGTGAEKPGT